KFTVTTAMLATTSGSIVTSTPASGDYFTQALLRLDGRTLDGNGVTAGDKWSLGLRYHTYEYTAMAGDDLLKVAFGLAKDIGEDTTTGSRFTVAVIKTATDVFLGIADPAGFNIHGLKLVNGAVVTTDDITQELQAAATVTRSTTLTLDDHTTPALFSAA